MDGGEESFDSLAVSALGVFDDLSENSLIKGEENGTRRRRRAGRERVIESILKQKLEGDSAQIESKNKNSEVKSVLNQAA